MKTQKITLQLINENPKQAIRLMDEAQDRKFTYLVNKFLNGQVFTTEAYARAEASALELMWIENKF